MAVKLNFVHMGMSAKDVAVRFMGIYEAQFEGLREAGAKVAFTLESPDPLADFIVCTADAKDIQAAVAQTKRPIILYVPPIDQWFDKALLESMRERVHFAYGPCLSGMTTDAYRALGISYYFLPFAADPRIMRPLNLAPRFDLAFLGGLQHRRGYQPYIEPLLKALDPNRLAFIGGGWQKYRIPTQSVDGLAADHPGLPERGPLTNNLYNLARVCINFHAPEQTRGAAIQLDCNNRLFDAAMAGCVQVSDNAEGVRMHFNEREVLAESAPDAWVACVLDCLRQPDSAFGALREAARKRAVVEHTWLHRARTFLGWIEQHAT